jgi:acetyl-CoA carboxylase biotin carboxyl carrier protein
VDIADLKEILRILEEQDITEFELEQDGVKLRVCRGAAAQAGVALSPGYVSSVPVAAPTVALAGGPLVTAGPSAAPAAPAAAGAPATATTEEARPAGTVVKSPIVGTFYRAPDPNSAPFVSVGDRVKVGQVLCIIEAMKLMNEIEAEFGGELLKIHVENGQPVQYGDPLFTVLPA